MLVGMRLFAGKVFDVRHGFLAVVFGNEVLGFVRREVFVEVIVDEANRSSPAGSEALGVFDRVVSTGGN
jgi:hypothetical protein